MQQQPLDYESPPRESQDRIRRMVGRFASAAWLLFGIASALLWFAASNQSSHLRAAAIFMAISLVLTAVLTVVYGSVAVVVWAHKRANANRVMAYASGQDKARSLAAGFQIHVTKAVDAADLVATAAGRAARG